MISYIAKIGQEYLFGPDNLQLINPKLTMSDNSAGSFDFTVPPGHPMYDGINLMTSEIEVFENNVKIWAGRPVESKMDFQKRIHYYCEGELAYLNDSVQPQTKKVGYTIQAWLEYLLSVHNAIVPAEKAFSIGIVTVQDSDAPRFTNYESTMKCINNIVKANGGHLRIRYVDGQRVLDYLSDYPGTAPQCIEFGRNLLDFSRNYNLTDIASAIVPLGAKTNSDISELEGRVTVKSVNQDSIYVLNQDLVQTYGQITKTVIWNDITDPSELLDVAQNWLVSGQYANMVLNINAIDMRWVEADVVPIKLLDQVRVISQPHGLDSMFPLTEMVLILNDPAKNTYQLGKTEQKRLTEKTEATAGAVETLTLTEPMSTQILLDQALANATRMLNAVNGGYVIFDINETTHQPYQILIMDALNKNTAQNVIRINQAGIGFSTHGYEGPYDTAWTIDGAFNASYITSGTLVANLIKAGILSDVLGKNSWNLETGEFAITEGTINISTSAETISKIVLNSENYSSEAAPYGTRYKNGNLYSEAYLNGFRTENNGYTTFDVVTTSNRNSANMVFRNSANPTFTVTGSNGNIGTEGNINATGNISSGGDVTATGDISSGGDIKTSDGKLSVTDVIENNNFRVNSSGTTIANGGIYAGCTNLDANTAEIALNPSGNITATGHIYAGYSSSAPTAIRLEPNGNGFFTGKITADNGIQSFGNIDATNQTVYASSFVQASDRRKKRNIKHITESYMRLLDELEPMLYNYIDNEEQEAGLIAQDVAEIEKKLGIPEDFLVKEKDGFLNIKYNNLFALLIKRMKGERNV